MYVRFALPAISHLPWSLWTLRRNCWCVLSSDFLGQILCLFLLCSLFVSIQRLVFRSYLLAFFFNRPFDVISFNQTFAVRFSRTRETAAAWTYIHLGFYASLHVMRSDCQTCRWRMSSSRQQFCHCFWLCHSSVLLTYAVVRDVLVDGIIRSGGPADSVSYAVCKLFFHQLLLLAIASLSFIVVLLS